MTVSKENVARFLQLRVLAAKKHISDHEKQAGEHGSRWRALGESKHCAGIMEAHSTHRKKDIRISVFRHTFLQKADTSATEPIGWVTTETACVAASSANAKNSPVRADTSTPDKTPASEQKKVHMDGCNATMRNQYAEERYFARRYCCLAGMDNAA